MENQKVTLTTDSLNEKLINMETDRSFSVLKIIIYVVKFLAGQNFLKVKIACQTFTLGCIYRPKITNESNLEVITALVNILQENNDSIIFGDFNYPEIKWKSISLSKAS